MDNCAELMWLCQCMCVLVCCSSASMQSFSADDSSRVLLLVPNTSGTDYINASFVDVSDAYKCSYCKGLRPNSVVDKLKVRQPTTQAGVSPRS